MHTIVLLCHKDFGKIAEDAEFGDKLYHSGAWNRRTKDHFEFLGETHSHESCAVLHYDGQVWCPSRRIKKETNDVYDDQPPEMFTVITVSGDFASLFQGMRKVGEHVISAVKAFSRDPEGHPVYVGPYSQAIQIVETFSSSDVGISVVEGNCSWLVGREATPEWARASRKSHSCTREVLELTLALKQGVRVNLTSRKIQKHVLEYF